MKNLAILIITFSVSTVFSQQIQSKKIIEGVVREFSSAFSWEFSENIFDKKDTIVTCTILYRNGEYKAIYDAANISFTSQESIMQFTAKLKEFAEINDNSTNSFKSAEYALNTSGDGVVYIYDKDKKWSLISKKGVLKLTSQLEANQNLLKKAE